MPHQKRPGDWPAPPRSGEPGHYAKKPELVIGLVGPLGTPLRDVYRLLEQELRAFSYTTRRVHLSSILESVAGLETELKSQNEYHRIKSRMDAGRELREKTNRGDILARLAISRIWDERSALADTSKVVTDELTEAPQLPREAAEVSKALSGTAYILDSLKNPDEVALLRRIYGEAFILVSAYAPREDRQATLAMRLSGNREAGEHSPSTLAAALIERDHAEEQAGDLGQRVSDVFALADLVVDTREHKGCEAALRRFLQGFFNYPFHSPTRDEYGMFLARCSALRSLDMSRQVGAVILDEDGSVLGQGHNDIPKHGGGLYWEDDETDGRDYSVGKDYSVAFRQQIVEEIVHGLAKYKVLNQEWQSKPEELIDYLYSGQGKTIWAHFIVSNLLEFGRALHAEMAAILDGGRKGLSVVGATLYCTTFPCHLCARMIIGAGIQRVVYMEPYHKSKTGLMYADSVEIDPSELVPRKVNFTPFVGIAPQKFEKLFTWSGKRREHDGTPIEWDPLQFGARIKRYIDSYIEIEAMTIEHTDRILSSAGLTWTPEKEELDNEEDTAE